MFYGTAFYYKILYYFTAMSPSYFLFVLQLNGEFENIFKGELQVFKISTELNVYRVCILILILITLCTLLLRFLLVTQYLKSSTDQVLGEDKQNFLSSSLEERNGGVMSFLLGNILPAGVIVGENIYVAILTFLILHMILFMLIMSSTDAFPNVMLIIMGMNLCKTRDNRFVFTFNSKKYSEFRIYQIGDPIKSKTYITMYNKQGVGNSGA